MNEYRHTPVMLNEVLEYLRPMRGGCFVDCTLGGGGYSFALCKIVGPQGTVVGIDPDLNAIEHVRERAKKEGVSNIITYHGNYKDIDQICKEVLPAGKTSGCDGVVFDLGLSQAQLEDRNRGFSFLLDAPLNMSFGTPIADENRTYEIVNYSKEEELTKIIKDYGEERYAKGIAKGIVKSRKNSLIRTSFELMQIVKESVPVSYRNNKRLHFATLTFQALRIATNNELENLSIGLSQSLGVLKPSGRIVAVSFHSLEDRIVKRFFKQESRECICDKKVPLCVCGHKKTLKILTPKVITPAPAEVMKNQKSRSAKLRAAEKI